VPSAVMVIALVCASRARGVARLRQIHLILTRRGHDDEDHHEHVGRSSMGDVDVVVDILVAASMDPDTMAL